MAISATQYFVIRELFEKGLLPANGGLLEIGEANWYGDVDPLAMVDDINRLVTDPVRREALVQRITSVAASESPTRLFEVAKVYYDIYFSPSELQAIDYGGTVVAKQLDLNFPVVLDRRFETVFNHGTAEHIFNIAQVFRTIHDYTLPGGLMIHESPFTGWVDHGFYCLQPTLFFDLAEANGYRVFAIFITHISERKIIQIPTRESLYEMVRTGQISDNSMLLSVLGKGPADSPFKIPIQGYYRGALSDSGNAAWKNLR